MKKYFWLIPSLLTLISLSSCEKDGGSGSSSGSFSSDSNSLPSLSTLYSYLGRTDYNAIANQFRQNGWITAIDSYDPEYNYYGTIEAEKGFPEPEYEEYGHLYEFEFDNAIYYASHEHDYYWEERSSVMHEHFDKIINGQKQLCKNWTLLDFSAKIQDANYDYSYYTSIDAYQVAAQHANFCGNTYGYSASTYSNGITIRVDFGEGYIHYRIYKTSTYNQRHNYNQ